MEEWIATTCTRSGPVQLKIANHFGTSMSLRIPHPHCIHIRSDQTRNSINLRERMVVRGPTQSLGSGICSLSEALLWNSHDFETEHNDTALVFAPSLHLVHRVRNHSENGINSRLIRDKFGLSATLVGGKEAWLIVATHTTMPNIVLLEP